MKKWIISLFACTATLTNLCYALDSNSNSPVGYWRTIDDVTKQPKAIVQIWETKDKLLFGKVVKIFPRPGHDQNEVCSECKGEKHNQRIVGMTVLEQLHPDKDSALNWGDGSILDPSSGKVYHCALQVVENGKKLNVRGYIGLPLFGRTQTWLRTDA